MTYATQNNSIAACAQAGRSTDNMPFLFATVFLSLCIPIFFSIAELHLSLSRLLLLALFPYLFFKVYSGQCGRVRWVDVGMLLFVVCLALSIFVNNREVFVTFVGSNTIIILGGYMAGRVFIRGPKAFVSFIKLFGTVLLFTLPFAIYESQTSVMVIARLLDQIPIISSSIDVDYRPRHGLYRVQVLFTHPIHYGLFASMCFSLVYIGLRHRLKKQARLAWVACIALCCFSSVSSGPFIAMFIQVLLIIYVRVASGLKYKWSTLIAGSVLIYTALDMLSTRPAYFAIVERIAFNSHTAFVRKILLEYGLAQVNRTPWLGVGYNDWELPDFMSGSLDNYWLLTALVYGVPAFLFLISAFLYALLQVGRRDFTASSLVNDLQLAWILVIASLMFTLSTVAIWSDIATLVFLFLGSGIWLIDHRITTRDDDTIGKDLPSRISHYTRFSQKTTQVGPTTFARQI